MSERAFCDQFAVLIGPHGRLQVAGMRKLEDLGPVAKLAQFLGKFGILWVMHFASNLHFLHE